MNNRGYYGIGLFNPKNHINVGSTIRACMNYRANFLAVQGRRYQNASSDTMKGYKHMPFFQVEDLRSFIPKDCIPIAVDLIEGATPLPEFNHPERAFYIFGPEDSTLGKNITSWCKHTIYVPTNKCMNLAATVNVIMYDRMCKQFNKILNR